MTTAAEFAKSYLDAPHGYEFASEEFAPLIGYVWSKFDGEDYVLAVYNMIQREYSKGKRCSVCGNTPAQSVAINYDCAYEC